MTAPEAHSWQSIQAEVIRRITERIWQPGELIPGEVELAEEFGCARATVNRALRELAGAGLLERRRKAGTRVALNPVRKATLDIPITRLEVERRGAAHRHALLERKRTAPPLLIHSRLGLPGDADMLHLRALHFADNHPFLYEDRWINLTVVPEILDVDFDNISANEGLVRNAPFSTGDISFSAANATKREAELLGTQEGTAVFVIDRITWMGPRPITSVRLAYAPGFRMCTTV